MIKTKHPEDIEKLKNLPIPTYFQLILYQLMDGYYDGTHRTDFSGSPVVCCPIHHETEPSFRYYEESNTFYCFGCGISGDVLSLHKAVLKELRGYEPKFYEVVKDLKRILKQLPEDITSAANASIIKNKNLRRLKEKANEASKNSKNSEKLYELEKKFDSLSELPMQEKLALMELSMEAEKLLSKEQFIRYDSLLKYLNKKFIFPLEAVSELQQVL